MKTWLTLLLSVILIYFLFFKEDTPPQKEPENVIVTKKVAPPSKSQESQIIKKTNPSPKIPLAPTPSSKNEPKPHSNNLSYKLKKPLPKKGPQPPPKNHVRFEIKDGNWVVTQGDLLLGKLIKKGDHNFIEPKNPRLWPTHEIPVAIDKTVSDVERIKKAISYFNENTVVRFVNYEPEDKNYIYFTKSEELCGSFLGMQGGPQAIRIHDRCTTQNIIHELMHALGFIHEHARSDRDRYLDVNWDNISPKYWIQFEILPPDLIHTYTGSVFDFNYKSIMIYTEFAFALDPKKPTLVSLRSEKIQRPEYGISEIDKERLFYLYGN